MSSAAADEPGAEQPGASGVGGPTLVPVTDGGQPDPAAAGAGGQRDGGQQEDGDPGIPEPRPVPVLNVANLLTLSRFALIPVFLAALFLPNVHAVGWRLAAAAVFAIASATDHIDGRLARGRGLVTDFGKIADPIADKALTGSALVGLSLLGELPWWVTLAIAVREIGVTLLRFWVIRHGVIPASRGGKAKTLAQVLAIGLFLLPLPAGADSMCWAVLDVALALTLLTGADYVLRALRLRARGRRAIAGAR